MLYNVLIYLIKGLLRLFNGKGHYEHHEKFNPEKMYLVVGPHRSLLDPVIFALALLPMKVSFMAKEELFQNPVIRWILEKVHVIPINREKPGAKSIKQAVRTLKAGDMSVGIFPTGSRYSDEIKPGAVSIAKMGDVELLPVVFQGPLKISDIFSRKWEKRVKCRVGEPIALPDVKRLSKEENMQLEQAIKAAFKENDAKLDPSFVYDVEAAKQERDARRQKKNKK